MQSLPVLALISMTFIAKGALADSDFFLETGKAQCVSECSITEVEAENQATEAANGVCAPMPARRVSPWAVHIYGYGRLHATAMFSCDTVEFAQ